MKVLVTGAHFTPAQATIEELKKLEDIDIIYIGRKHTMEGDPTPSVESQILPKLGVKFIPISAGRLRRFLSLGTLVSLFKIPIGFIQAFYYLVKEQPDVGLSFGGYTAVPVVVSAWLLSIPIITHEQTLVSGLANKICSFFADRIAVSFDIDYSFPKDKITLTGNPTRVDLINAEPKKFPLRPMILIIGGNQGSHLINESVSKILDELTDLGYVIHQVGDSKFKDYEKLMKQKKILQSPERYQIYKFIDSQELGSILKSADLVISRAGANILTELALFGIPTLLIPIPYLYQDEQNVNAKFFAELGLVDILSQKELTPDNLIDKVKNMLTSLDKLKKKAKTAKNVVIKDAAKRLTLEVLLLAHQE